MTLIDTKIPAHPPSMYTEYTGYDTTGATRDENTEATQLSVCLFNLNDKALK